MISRLKRFIKTCLLKYKFKDLKVNGDCDINMNSIFEGANLIGSKTQFSGKLGLGSYLGDNCRIDGSIGRFCSIGNQVTTLIGTHPTNKFVSTSPMFYSTKNQNGSSYVSEQRFEENLFADKENSFGVIIGNDVWIGHGATIMGGISIGDGAIIAAKAVVTKDVAPYTIVGGIPAELIKSRFDEHTVKKLLEFKWWDMPQTWIQENAALFSDIESFISLISEDKLEN